MPLESMPTELIGEICDNLCYVDRKALFEASRGSLELRDDIERWLHLDPLSTVVNASLNAYEGRCIHVTPRAIIDALDDIEIGLRCHLQKTEMEYFHLDRRFPYTPQHHVLTQPSDYKYDARHRYIPILLSPRCDGQAHYEYYLEVMEAYAERRSRDPNPLLPIGSQGGNIDIALYDVLKRVRSYVHDWICELRFREKLEEDLCAGRRVVHATKWLKGN